MQNKPRNSMQKATVMLIEDAKDLAVLYERFLAGFGVNILRVESGKKALEILHSQKPDLLIMDLSLKDIPTVDFYEQFKAIPEIQNVPLILISGRDDLNSWAPLFGAKEAFKKPVESERVLQALQTYLVPESGEVLPQEIV